MMTRTHILLALSLLALPTTAAAYLSPEEVLFSDSGQMYEAPPNHRTTGDRIDSQMLTSAERRKQEQAINYANQHPALPEEPVHAAPPEEPKPATLEDVLSAMQQTLEKLGSPEAQSDTSAEEMDAGMSIDSWEDPSTVQSAGDSTEVLHSGAPLNASGPGMWVAAIAVAGAVCWTMLRAKKGAFYRV
ncbi:hypothetical protein HZA87_02400 [Candidatus Uhrbacteria bacterium]|nr:hypothetical protein [Candidatus Uhrbacteria bacterium]